MNARAFVTFKTLLFSGLLVLLAALPAHAASADWAPSRSYQPDARHIQQVGRLSAMKGTGIGQIERVIQPLFAPLTAQNLAGPIQTGEVLPLAAAVDAAQLYWEPVAGGHTARVRFQADFASGLRVHALLSDAHPKTEIRLQGAGDAQAIGPFTGSDFSAGELWLPLTSGNLATLEIFVPAEYAPQDVSLQLDRVNYLYQDSPAAGRKSIKLQGRAQQTQYDAACFANQANYSAIQGGVAATAWINFVKGPSSYICTGTLLNDWGGTGTPWFITAAHCIDEQTVAGSMIFDWHYEATTCGGSTLPASHIRTYGGAQLIWSDATYDATFLMLLTQPPSNVQFAGWSASVLTTGEPVLGIHHPQGDLTAVSLGRVGSVGVTINNTTTGGQNFANEVNYTTGGVEQGSSGSGVFTTPTNSEIYFRGTLIGAPATNYQDAFYSPFSDYYFNIRKYLRPSNVDTTPPSVPANVMAVALSPTSVYLSWDASSDNVGVTSYKIYNKGVLVDTLGNITHSTRPNSASNTYIYTVAACDAANNCSAQSYPLTITTPPTGTVVQFAQPSTVVPLSPGFYIVEATLGAGMPEGYWGLEVLTSKGQAAGGFNLGGGLDGNSASAGFGAFMLTTTQRVLASVDASFAPTSPMTLRFLDGNTRAVLAGPVSGPSGLQLAATLPPGFYIAELTNQAAAPLVYAMGLAANFFAGGVDTGGFLQRGNVGFGAFYVPESQNVTIKLYGRNTYGDTGAGNLVLTLKDANRNVLRVLTQ